MLKGAMELSGKLPEEAGPHDHLVHFYGRDQHALVTNVGRFFRVGLRRGESLLAIATLEHCDGFARELHREPKYQSAVRDGRIMFLDAEQVLAQCSVGARLALDQLEMLIMSTLQELRLRRHSAPIRVYGEMVGVLWRAGRIDVAVELEQRWQRLVLQNDISLVCGYPINRLDRRENPAAINAIVGQHTHFISSTAAGAAS
jgi:MEDS: MEthanogen/methylotroph, DcmR Sensory domain